MRRPTEKSGLDLLEEATALLRQAPASAWLSYYAGSLPFVLGLLYFWSDMSRSALAADRLPGSALGLALLFLWMKSWQAVFAHQLLCGRRGEPGPRWTAGWLVRLSLGQAITQPWGLVLLPVALVLMAPFGWVYAFFQNLTALAGTETGSVRRLVRHAWQQAWLWPGQNHAVILVLPWLVLVVFLNWFTGTLALWWVLDKVFGLQTPFAQSGWAVWNTTFLAALGAATYLCLDPLCKAVYVLRCFYGQAIRSGADLQADLRRLAAVGPSSRAALLIGVALIISLNCPAAPGLEQAEPVSPPGQAAASSGAAWAFAPAELDRAIDRALEHREFLWRMPRERPPKSQGQAGWLERLLQGLTDSLKAPVRPVLDTVGRWLRNAVRWLARRLAPIFLASPTPGDWTGPLRAAVGVLIAALVGVLLGLLFRLWQTARRRPQAAAASQRLRPEPDVADPNVGADELPEDAWTQLARQLLERGELRLALRALYLSSLAHLANRGLIALARFKSNLDYATELGRRAHVWPELVELFWRNVAIFDRVWYGLHEVSHELLEEFAGNVQRMKTT